MRSSTSCGPTAFEHVDFDEMWATVDGVITTPDGQKAAWFKDSEGSTSALSMADWAAAESAASHRLHDV